MSSYNCNAALQKLAAKGIDIEVWLADFNKKLELEDDGWIFWLRPEERINFKLRIQAPRVPGIKVIIVQGRTKRIQKKKDETPEGELAIFERIISAEEVISALPEEEFSTKPKNHNLRIVVVEKSRFELWEVAIVTLITQRADYHLTIQKVYSATLYQRAGKVYASKKEFPRYEDWNDLPELLEDMVDTKTLEEFQGEEGEAVGNNNTGLKENTGIIIFYNLANMWGFAKTNQGGAFLHWRQIEDGDPFPMKETGETIEFKALEKNLKGLQIIGARTAKAGARQVSDGDQ